MARWAWPAAACALAGVAGTAAVVVLGTPAAGEDALARRVQEIGPWFEPISVLVRWLTHTVPVVAIGALFALGLVATGERRRAASFAALMVAMVLLQTGIKEALDRERPSESYVDVRDTWTSPSYPAGHLMSGTFLWGYLVLARTPPRAPPRAWTAVRRLSAAVVVVNIPANVYMGVHWPTDVLGGLLLGAALAAALLALEARRAPPAITGARTAGSGP